jgi:hypothetical protein
MTKPVADGSVAGIVDRDPETSHHHLAPVSTTGIRGFIRKSGSESFRRFIAALSSQSTGVYGF